PAGRSSPILATANRPIEEKWDVDNTDMTTANGSDAVSGYTLQLRTSTVTYTIFDPASMQEWVCSFTVTVVDDEAPVILNCSSADPLFANFGITFENEPGLCGLNTNYTILAEDNCDALVDVKVLVTNPSGLIRLDTLVWDGTFYTLPVFI